MIPGSTNQLLAAGVGYQISRSVRLRSGANGYFSRTPASAGNRKTWTWSAWVKLGSMTGTMALFSGGTTSRLSLQWDSTNGGNLVTDLAGVGTYDISPAVYRDYSGWYHIVWRFDSTQATVANISRVFVNGSEITLTKVRTFVQNTDYGVNTAELHTIGAASNSTTAFKLDAYLTEINFIDGQALTPSSFGETNPVTGVWQPKKYTGTYGTNGFYLNFSDNSGATATTIGKDSSGNGNNWTPNNISVTANTTYDSMLDVPTPYADGSTGRGNYCVLNPLNASASSYISGGNLNQLSIPNTYELRGTLGVSSGKWYFEVTLTNDGATLSIGISAYSGSAITPYYPGSGGSSYGYLGFNGNKYNNTTGSAYGNTFATNDVIGVAFDLDNGKIWFSKNGVWQSSGDPAAGTNAAFTGIASNTYYPAIGRNYASAAAPTSSANFGQRPFTYTPPSGFKALNTLNLPTPTILKGNQYFDAKLYTGNGTTQSITGMAFAPDLVWTKSRSAAVSHGLFDTVRGAGKALFSNATNAEFDYGTTTSGELYQFTSDGFNLGSFGNFNANGTTYVAWQWKEGATQGFDIVTYTGNGANRTIAHNLGVAPSMIIIKARTQASAYNWVVGHSSLNYSGGEYLLLNTTAAKATSSVIFNNTAPTSSAFSVGTFAWTNGNADTFVAYLFSEVAGFSRFGSYTGNGSADGPFVFCGFRPRWVMIKCSSAAGTNWAMFDTSRNPSNVAEWVLYANSSSAEASGVAFPNAIDILSNGFKTRNYDATYGVNINTNGATYIFAAFAEVPFRYALAR